MRCTIFDPRASTAPLGCVRLGAWGADASTLNSRMLVPFQIPVEPGAANAEEAKMKPQSSDSYQPRDNGDHSKRCTRIALGSIIDGNSELLIMASAVPVSPVSIVPILGARTSIKVRMVCKGRSVSHVSTYQHVS